MAEKKSETKAGGKTAAARGGRKAPAAEGASAGGDGLSQKQPPKTGRGDAKGGGKSVKTGAKAATGKKKPDLKKDLRDFASARPSGWSHDDWLNFLESLRDRGHNVNDRDAIGMALERERLDIALDGIKGVGPQRRKALVERYGTLWNLRAADPQDISEVAGIKHDLAEQVKSQVS